MARMTRLEDLRLAGSLAGPGWAALAGSAPSLGYLHYPAVPWDASCCPDGDPPEGDAQLFSCQPRTSSLWLATE